MSKSKIPRRGRFAATFLDNPSVRQILKIVNENNELDAQLRDGYFNVYVDGGNALRVSKGRGRSINFFFDKFYFYNDGDVPKTYVEEVLKGEPRENPPSNYPSYQEALALMKEPTRKHAALLQLLENDSIEEFFSQAVPVVKDWVERKKRFERRNQHVIACSNREFTPDNNLVVVDIEFAVSSNKPYSKTTKVPKLDIIAVDKKGQIYCIELKDNRHADRDNSSQNVDAHKLDFDNTVGNHVPENDFVQEMKEVVDVKKNLGLLPQNIKVDTSLTPIFAVAYSGNDDDKIKFLAKHSHKYKIVTVNEINNNNIRLKLE